MKLEVVAMVYRDPEFLVSIRDEIVRYLPDGASWRIVGNDANAQVMDAAKKHHIPIEDYRDPEPSDWYLSRVYRCWNYCVKSSTAESVVLVNSDMMFSPGWLEGLLAAPHGTIPVSRLAEPCRIKNFAVAPNGIQIDFSRQPKLFPRDAWLEFVAAERSSGYQDHGGFMPCLLDRKLFLEAGGYPEGNVIVEDDGTVIVLKPNPPRIDVVGPRDARVDGKPFFSGDDFLFRKLEKMFGLKHVTCMDSLVYHMQEGEMSP